MARFREDVSWAMNLGFPVDVIDKRAANVGRESLSFLQYIIEHYRSLPADSCLCFSQGTVGKVHFRWAQGGPESFKHAWLPAGKDVSSISKSQRLLHYDLCGALCRLCAPRPPLTTAVLPRGRSARRLFAVLATCHACAGPTFEAELYHLCQRLHDSTVVSHPSGPTPRLLAAAFRTSQPNCNVWRASIHF